MYKFAYVRGKKIITYDDYEIAFKKGLNVIRGANRSGKSLSLSTIGNILFFAPPISTTKNSAKRLLHHNTALSTVGFEVGKEMVHIEQFPKGKTGVGYRVFRHKVGTKLDRDKHNTKVRGDVKVQIRRLFRQNDDLFYNTCYISGLRPNVLQTGKAADRYNFFQRVFRLTVFDKIRKELDKQLKTLARDDATLTYLRGERERLPEMIDISHTKKALKKAQAKYDRLNDEVKEAQSRVTALTAVTTLVSQLSDSTLTMEQVEQTLAKASKTVSTLEKTYKDLVRQQADAEAAEEAKGKRDKITTNLEKLSKVTGTIDECTETILHLEEDIPVLSNYLDDLDEAQGREAERDAMLKTLHKLWGDKKRVPLLSGKQLEQEIEKSQAKVASAKETLASFADLSGHKNCPTCQQALNNKMITGMLKQAKEDKAEHSKRLEMLALMKEINSTSVDRPAGLPKRFKNPSRDGLAALEEQLGKEKKRLEYLRLKQKLEEQLELLPKPRKIKDVSKQLSETNRALKEARATVQTAKADKRILEQLSDNTDVDIKTAPAFLKKAKKTLAELSPAVQKANNTVQKLKLERADLSAKLDQITHLDEQIVKLSDSTRLIPVYQGLMKAYGPKGMRIDRIRALAELYVERLNDYAPLIYGEDFRFEINLAPNKFDLIAHRSGVPGDVNMLSGSEVRCFQLLSFLALLSMVPKEHRTNFVVLDELEANMDQRSRELYAKQFLPKLKELVDVVFVITPTTEQEFHIDGVDHNYRVTKTKGTSKIMEMAA